MTLLKVNKDCVVGYYTIIYGCQEHVMLVIVIQQ